MARARTQRRMHALHAAGVPELNYPEGTTSAAEGEMPFLRGCFGIAQRAGVPVVPLAIRDRDASLAWCDDVAFLPHYLKMATRPRVEIDLVFGTAMSPRAGEPAEDMAVRARHSIVRMLGRLHATERARVSPSRSDSVLPAPRVA
jgi:1-acyl-sn-glycerol-3-phosphate acyltransferase